MRFLPRLLMLVSLAAPLAHAELLDDVHQRGALRIALEGTYPPFNFKQGGKLTGFETELGELLAAELAKSVAGVNVRTYPGAPEYLQDLASKRIDAALNDRLLIPFAIREAKLPVKPGAAVGPVANMAIPYRKNNPKFGEALNAALEKIKADGRFAKLSEKWFGLDVSQPPK
ncbi:TPA: transporter substrate-binding domain-containing protein [Pseudomonas aeruginosa]|nr:transporter substrate-binding domain-containing protein [Pseudomonas aeruginosa]